MGCTSVRAVRRDRLQEAYVQIDDPDLALGRCRGCAKGAQLASEDIIGLRKRIADDPSQSAGRAGKRRAEVPVACRQTGNDARIRMACRAVSSSQNGENALEESKRSLDDAVQQMRDSIGRQSFDGQGGGWVTADRETVENATELECWR